MKTRTFRFAMLAALAALSLAGLSGSEQTASPDEQKLTALEQNWGNAYIKRDAAFVERITSDDFSFTGPDGNTVNKADYVKGLTGRTVFSNFQISDLKVRIHGNAAVVTGVAAITARTNDKDESGRYAFSDTFIKEGAEWRAVSGQATKVAAKE